jgi:fructokinase
MSESFRQRAVGPRIGIDLGGTKIEGIVLGGGEGQELHRLRVPCPRNDYDGTITALRDLVAALEHGAGQSQLPAGLAIPGSISRATGLMHNANSTWLNGRPFVKDLSAALGRAVKAANDANCFALSEASDGAAAGAASMFGVILGTGVGGGLVFNGRLIDGPLGIGGEWGHNPLPWLEPDEYPGPKCWCGRRGCMESWVSGPALAADHARVTAAPIAITAEHIVAAAASGDKAAHATLDRHARRLARGLAHVANIFDPEIIVLGGGLSKLAHLYEVLPALMAPHIFCDAPRITIRPPRWGDASGVRGAAWLAGV